MSGLLLLRKRRKRIQIFGVPVPGCIAYWPQTEASGTVADNAEGNAARDGLYYTDANVTQQGSAFPVGDNVAYYGGSGCMRYGSASLAGALSSLNHFWFMLWVHPDDAAQSATDRKYSWMRLRGTGSTTLDVYHSNAAPYYASIDHRPDDTTVSRMSWGDYLYSPNYQMIVGQLNNGLYSVWLNGTPVKANGTTALSTDSMSPVQANNMIAAALGYGVGAFPHYALGTGVLTTDTVNALYEAVYPGAQNLFITGDSHATNDDYWIGLLVGALDRSAIHPNEVWRERPYRVGYSGQRVAYWNTNLPASLAAVTGNPAKIGVNIGANDISGGTVEATVKANLAGGIDTLRAKWPNADIYVAQPYRDDYHDGRFDAYALGLRQWILDVIATYPQHVFAGPDENTWFKGEDIDTYSSDRIHPTTTAGMVECAAQWQAAMGY